MAQLSTGRIAVLPAAAKMGDLIAAFNGGHSLHLVRAILGRLDAYTFIGECYVDGLMDGAFLEVCDENDRLAKLLKLV